MTWGIPTDTFLQLHVILSLIGIAAGLVMVYRLLTGGPSGVWTPLFLGTTILTCITGFPLAPFGFDAARAIGILVLALLAIAVVALYLFHLAGAWRWIFIAGAVTSLYLNSFVAVVQAFQKLPALKALAPTQSEPPFVVVQVAVLAAFCILGILAVIRFHPEVARTA